MHNQTNTRYLHLNITNTELGAIRALVERLTAMAANECNNAIAWGVYVKDATMLQLQGLCVCLGGFLHYYFLNSKCREMLFTPRLLTG